MKDRDRLLSLLAAPESDHLERTTSTKNTDKFCEAICAFANDMPNHGTPGHLIIGANDDHSLAQIQISDQLISTLGNMRTDGRILPSPSMTVAKETVEGSDLAIVTVQPSDLPPVRYKGRVHIRIGPRKAIANEQDERILNERRVALARSFDARACRDASIDDLALAQFDAYRREAVDADTIDANHRSLDAQLSSLRFYEPKQACPTHAGVLLFAKNPRFFFPGDYVQFCRFPGPSMADSPEDQAEISGDLSTILHEMGLRLRTVVQTGMSAKGLFDEKLSATYPEWAIRELFTNAIMHRDYESNTPVHFYMFSDRIEIQNPGGLYGEVTQENFPDRSSYRNPILAEALKNLGFVNRFGYGVNRAQSILKKAGHPPAEFTFDRNGLSVQVYGRSK